MYIIAGLGNPGRKYENTSHNTGFRVLDGLADRYGIAVEQRKHKALCGTGMVEGQKVLLMKPQTYMNLSGESIREAVEYYRVDPECELLVIYDDISLEPGQLRIRKKGSSGIWGRRYFPESRWAWAKSRKDTIWRIMCWGTFRRRMRRRCRKHATGR